MASPTADPRMALVRPFGTEELNRLLARGAGPCVSIYLPTHRRHPEWKQDPVRFRALVVQAEALLAERQGAREAKPFLEPVRRMEDSPHWEHSLEGFAIFHSPELTVAYRLPYPVPERAVVSDTFHTKPLLRFLHANQRYRVLAVSQNEVTLYEGSPFGAAEVDLSGMPESLLEALGVPDHDRAFSQRAAGPSGPMVHGRGPGREQKKEDLLRYFRAIDRGLRDYLRDERTPLLLAAVGYYHPIYREANTYPHLEAEGLEGNFERTGAEQIHAAAWPSVRRYFERLVGEWAARVRELAGTGLASDRIEDVAPAVLAGRVRGLLLEEGAILWGEFDRSTGRVRSADRQERPDDVDLLDEIGEEALRKGAEVLVVPRASMPTPSPLAAVYRY